MEQQNPVLAELVMQADALAQAIALLPLDVQVQALNAVRERLHAASPFRDEPVDLVLWVPGEQVEANDYNPNVVAPPEMRLLERSISEDGYTQPIVAMPSGDGYEIVDGFHRSRVGKERKHIKKRVRGYLPITAIRATNYDRSARMAATIRHNRARGTHKVFDVANIVRAMICSGMDDASVAQALGMDSDELLRLKQQIGLPQLFANQAFSSAWE